MPNQVPAAIKFFAEKQQQGKFTFQAGRTDKIVNLTAGALLLVCLGMSASGYHKLQHGYGKKDGF
ncbi:hypothetical protein MMPV_004945 [Pyropia vietnamensis]